jgi:hypothetical protein
MTRPIIAALLLALPAPALADAAKPDLDLQVRCAALFALVAGEQARKAPGSDRFPAMGERGKAFFVDTGVRLIDERGLPREAIEPMFRKEIGAIQAEFAAAPDPAARADAQMALCLPLLPPVLPPPRKG